MSVGWGVGEVLGRNSFLRQGWLVSAQLKDAVVTPSVEGLNYLVSLTFHRAQASLERLTYPPTPPASSFSRVPLEYNFSISIVE